MSCSVEKDYIFKTNKNKCAFMKDNTHQCLYELDIEVALPSLLNPKVGIWREQFSEMASEQISVVRFLKYRYYILQNGFFVSVF